MISFNADEVFEMAEQIERNGAKFYRKAAASAAPAPKKVMLGLAEMEDRHEKTFHEMRTQLSKAERTGVTFDPDDEGASYLRAMADGKVFNVKDDPSEKLSGHEPPEQVFRIAIGLEKDSIVFYLAMKQIVPDGRGRERMDDIIREEMSHITLLTKQIEALAS